MSRSEPRLWNLQLLHELQFLSSSKHDWKLPDPPFHSLFPFTLYKGRFCTSCASLSPSPSESPSACLMPLSVEEKIPEAAWGQRGCGAPRGSGTWMWTVPAGVRRQKELLLVLTDKSGHKEIQRKWPGALRWGGQREGGGLLSKNCTFCGMEDKKNWELLIPSLAKGRKRRPLWKWQEVLFQRLRN